jgi:Tfp pilus assembly protein PilO
VSRNLRILIAAVVALAAVAGYWKLALAPKRQEAARLEQQLATAQSQLATAQTTLSTYRQAKVAYRPNYATTVRLGKAVPADDDSRSLLVQLDYAAKHSGVDFSNIDVGSASASSGPTTATTSSGDSSLPPGAISAGTYSELPFQLAFTGDFGGLTNFFGRLQRFVTVHGDKVLVGGRLLRIESIDIEPGDGGWPTISAKMGASAYIVPAAQGLKQGSASASSGAASGGSTNVSTSTASNLR